MGATQEQQSDPDQAGIANAAIATAWGLCLAIFVGAFWQLVDPMPKPPAILVPYRCFMIGLLLACPAWAYLNVRLGGAKETSEHRSWYVRFRTRIISGDASGYYTDMIRRVLARVDAFFDDAYPPVRRNWTHAVFGLRDVAPLWTAPAYDRCLMLALIYPITVIFLVWAWSGHVGVSETALGLSQATDFGRVMTLFGIVAIIRSWQIADRLSGWKSFVVRAFAVVGTFAVVVAGGASASGIFGGAFVGAGAFLVAVAVAFIVAVAIAFGGPIAVAGALILAGAGVFPSTHNAAFFFVSASAISAVGIFDYLIKRNRVKIGLLLFTISIFILIVILSRLVSGYPRSSNGLPWLYFLPLLTIVNAPFDWLSLGMTRGLLRRGLERGGIEPLLLGLLDLIISMIIMAMLAVAVLWATEIFNHAVISGGGEAIVDPARQLALLANPATRGDYEHWWLYAMLFSTQLPAIANITFGTFCLLRGLPIVNRWIAGLLPASGGIGLWQRLSVATATAAQFGLAVTMGLIGLYYLYFWGLVALVDATFGVTLIELLRSVSLGLS
jgi:hypothetical protein